MNRVLAICGIAIRNAIRSRVVLSLLVILILVIIGLPLTLQSDGTPEGHVQLLIGYTLGFSTIILSWATLWAGCASISLEIEERQVQLVTTKPVHRFQLWLGKWLGLMVVNLILLLFCGVATYGLLRWTIGAATYTPAEQTRLRDDVLATRKVIEPDRINVDEAARAALKARLDTGDLPEGITPEDALKVFRQNLLAQAYTVQPGGSLRWTFALPAHPHASQEMTLRAKFSSSRLGTEPVTGIWYAGSPDASRRFEQTMSGTPGMMQSIKIPVAAAADSPMLVVEYANTDEQAVTVVFSPDQGLSLLVPWGSFEMNFARALLMILGRLALLAALGVTAGSIFSMPVAALVSLFFVILLQSGSYIESLTGQTVASSLDGGSPAVAHAKDLMLGSLFRILHVVLKPLESPNPLSHLAAGQLVSWAWVIRAWLISVVLYGGLLAAVGSAVLRRRELALPSS